MDFYSKVTVVMGFAALLAAAYALYWARRANNELRALLREMEPSIDVAWRKAEEDYLRIDDGRLNAILHRGWTSVNCDKRQIPLRGLTQSRKRDYDPRPWKQSSTTSSAT